MWGEHELGLRLPGEGSCFQQPSRGGPSPARPGVQLQLGMGWRRLGRETEPHSWGLPVLCVDSGTGLTTLVFTLSWLAWSSLASSD